MDPVLLAQILNTLASTALEAYKIYENSSVVLSESDATAIHEALLKAEEATALLRPQVDATLAAAATR